MLKKNHLSNWALIIGQLLAQLSDRMMSLGLIWIINENFGERWVTWYLVLGGLPHLLFSVYSGQIIQKVGALRTVISADLVRAVIYFIGALFFHSISGERELIFVMGLIFLANSFSAFFNPAILTLPIELEKDTEVQKLTARLSTVSSLTIVIGPLVGMFCFKLIGLKGLFFVTSLAYLLSGICAFSLRSRAKEAQSLKSVENEKTVSFLETLKSNELVVSMLLVFLFLNLFSSPLQVQIPYLAKNLFSGSFNSMAAMEMGLGIGIVCGGLGLSVFSIIKRELFYTWLFLTGIGVFFLSFQYSFDLLFAVACLSLMGFFVGLANILIINIFQSRPEAKHVPNIMSAVNLIGTAAVPLSLAISGVLQSSYSISQIGRACGFVLLVICLASYVPFKKWGKELF